MAKFLVLFMTLFLLITFSGCAGVVEEHGDQAAASPSPILLTMTQAPSESQQPSPTDTPVSTSEPTATPVVVLPPEPISIQFTASDGQELTGLYFPAAENPAPIIVLMPWSRGNQSEWEEVAYWLQGRGLLVRAMNSRETWKSSNWYPELSLDNPIGVFTFNFRSCEGEDGCQAYLPSEWLLDAQAALVMVSQLEGADPERIITAGASNGADGAVDSCAWINTTDLGTCLGAFALSPSSALTVDFRTAAGSLLAQDKPALVYCLYGLLDDASQETCEDYLAIRSIHFGYSDDHGLELIRVDRKPDPLDLLQEFINGALEVHDE